MVGLTLGCVGWGAVLRTNGSLVSWIAGAQAAVAGLLVAVSVWIALYLGGWNESAGQLLLLSFIIGVLASSSSPALAVAVTGDAGSVGGFTQTTIAISFVKDILILIILTATSLLTIGADIGQAVGTGAALGVGLGVVIWLYTRLIKSALVWFLAGLGGCVLVLCGWFGVPPLIVFVIAGVVVAGAASVWPFVLLQDRTGGSERPPGEVAAAALEKIQTPLLLLFFVFQGMHLNVSQIWPWVGLLGLVTIARAQGIIWGTKLGVRMGRIREQTRGLSSAALADVGVGGASAASVGHGAVLGAVGVSVGVGAWGPVLAGVGAINALVGSVLFRRRLTVAGESAGARARALKQSVAIVPANKPSAAASSGNGTTTSAFPEPCFEDERINVQVERIRGAILRAIQDFDTHFVRTTLQDHCDLIVQLRQATHQVLTDLAGSLESHKESITPRDPRRHAQRTLLQACRVHIANRFLRVLGADRDIDAGGKQERRAFKHLLISMDSALISLDGQAIESPLSPHLFLPSPSDSLPIRLKKCWWRWRLQAYNADFDPTPTRVINVHRLARFFISGLLPERLIATANTVGYQKFFTQQRIEHAARRVNGALTALLDRLDQEKNLQETITSQTIYETQSQLDAEFDQIIADHHTLSDDISRRLRVACARAYQQTLHACSTAGTLLLPNSTTRYARVHERSVEGKLSIKQAILRWRQASVGALGRLMTHLDLISLQHSASSVISEAQTTLSDALNRELRPKPEMVQVSLKNTHKALDEQLTPSADLSSARQALIDARDDLLDLITRQAIARLEVKRDRGTFSDLLGDFFQGLRNVCLEVQVSHVIAEASALSSLDEGSSPPPIKLSSLPLRELARRSLLTEVPARLASVNSMIKAAVDQTIGNLSNVLRILTYQLDTLITDLSPHPQSPSPNAPSEPPSNPDDNPDEQPPALRIEAAREAILSGLLRCRSLLQESLAMISEVDQQVCRLVAQETEAQVSKLADLSTQSRWQAIQRFLDRKPTHTNPDDPDDHPDHADPDPNDPNDLAPLSPSSPLSLRISRKLSLSLRVLTKRLRHARSLYNSLLSPALRSLRNSLALRLGLQAPAHRTLIELTDDILRVTELTDTVPLSYRRPFESSPVDLDEFFIARDDELAQAHSAISRFHKKLPSSILVSGEEGSGKTSFVERILRKLPSLSLPDAPPVPLSRLSISHTLQTEDALRHILSELFAEPVPSLDHLRARLRASRRARILVIEGLHKLFLRSLHGTDALQKFLLLISETSHVILWVVTINSDALQVLRQMVRVEDSFTHHIHLSRFTPSQIRSVIETRHRVTGFHLRFRSTSTLSSPALPAAHTPPTSSASPAAPNKQAPKQTVEDRPWWRRLTRSAQHAQHVRADLFFHLLARHCSGNIRLALFYWLRSLDASATQGRQGLSVQPLQPIDTAFVHRLDLDQRLTLALLIQHGGLTLPEVISVTRMPHDLARSLLTNLLQTHILSIERGQSDIYRVNSTLFPLIADHLRELKML